MLLHICVPITPRGMDVAWIASFVYPTVSLTSALSCLSTDPFLSSGPSSQAWFFSCPHSSDGAAVPGYGNPKHSQLLPVVLTHSIKALAFFCPSYAKRVQLSSFLPWSNISTFPIDLFHAHAFSIFHPVTDYWSN